MRRWRLLDTVILPMMGRSSRLLCSACRRARLPMPQVASVPKRLDTGLDLGRRTLRRCNAGARYAFGRPTCHGTRPAFDAPTRAFAYPLFGHATLPFVKLSASIRTPKSTPLGTRRTPKRCAAATIDRCSHAEGQMLSLPELDAGDSAWESHVYRSGRALGRRARSNVDGVAPRLGGRRSPRVH